MMKQVVREVIQVRAVEKQEVLEHLVVSHVTKVPGAAQHITSVHHSTRKEDSRNTHVKMAVGGCLRQAGIEGKAPPTSVDM